MMSPKESTYNNVHALIRGLITIFWHTKSHFWQIKCYKSDISMYFWWNKKNKLLATCQKDRLSLVSCWTLIRPFPPSPSLSHVHKEKKESSSLLHRVIPVKHLQVLLGSLPNISCTAIKPHFTTFHTIISDECYLELSLRLRRGTWKGTLSSFGISQTVNSLWRSVQSASVLPFTRRLFFVEEKTEDLNHGGISEECLFICCFTL